MNARNLTIGGILLTAFGAWVSRVTGLVTDDQLLFALDLLIFTGIVLIFMIGSYGVSWGATQAYKVLYHKPATWAKDAVKRKIYRVAIWTGGMSMLACGSFFLLAENLSLNEKLVVGIFWSLLCAFVGLTSPHLWRFAFENLLPRLKRWAKGRERGDNEALDRPSEVPRE